MTGLVGIVVAGLAVALLGLVPVLDRRAGARRIEWWRGGLGSRRAPAAVGAHEGGPVRRVPGGRPTADPSAALAMLVAEVAARLRAGAPASEAWGLSWARAPALGPLGGVGPDGTPGGVVRMARVPRWTDLLPGAGGTDRDGTDRSGADRGGTDRDGTDHGGLGGPDGPDEAGGGSCELPPAGPWPRRAAVLLRSRGARATAGRRAAAALLAACRFTHRLGAPLAEVLEVVADGIDESAAAEEARRVAGTGPRTSARVLTALPLLGILVGEALGAGTLARLVDGGVGTLCLLVGSTCLVAGHLVSARMLRRAEEDHAAGRAGPRGSHESVDPAILCDLAVAGLESGASVPTVLEAIGTAADLPELGRIGRELVLGVAWARAWDPCPVQVLLLGEVLEPAWNDGTSPVPLLRRAAAQVRARRVADARARAEELGVRLVVPLGALLLPAFLALGVVPVLMHLASGGVLGVAG